MPLDVDVCVGVTDGSCVAIHHQMRKRGVRERRERERREREGFGFWALGFYNAHLHISYTPYLEMPVTSAAWIMDLNHEIDC